MNGLDLAARLRGRFFVVSHHGDNAGAELVYSWLGLVEHFMPRLKDACPPTDFGPTEDRLLAAMWLSSASGEPFHATGEFEGERFSITVLPRNCVPFESGDWFWDQDDTESAEDTANGILHAKGPMELVCVVGAVQTRPRWGFIAPEKGTDGGLIARWYDSEREGMEALHRVSADQEVDGADAEERARADQEAVEGEPEGQEALQQPSTPAKPIAAELPPLSARQLELARNALGFPNAARQSYRNRFATLPSRDDAEDWLDLIDAGFAIQTVDNPRSAVFALTRAGAERALKPGESLNVSDFPRVEATPHDA